MLILQKRKDQYGIYNHLLHHIGAGIHSMVSWHCSFVPYKIGRRNNRRNIFRCEENFSCYLTASGFKADINNLRLGERRTVEAKNAEEMKCTMEGWFQKWMAEDPGGHFTYSDP